MSAKMASDKVEDIEDDEVKQKPFASLLGEPDAERLLQFSQDLCKRWLYFIY